MEEETEYECCFTLLFNRSEAREGAKPLEGSGVEGRTTPRTSHQEALGGCNVNIYVYVEEGRSKSIVLS